MFQKSKYKLKMKGVLFPNGPNPDIAIEINPFIVKWFIDLISRWEVQLPSYRLERMCVSIAYCGN